jgi:orotate phosphoribosyltransferase
VGLKIILFFLKSNRFVRMAKLQVYTQLFDNKVIEVKEFITHGEKTYKINFNKTLANPKLFDNITLLIENVIKTSELKFDRICATSTSAIPYATNVATSLEKAICYAVDQGNDRNEKGCIKNIKIEGGMEIDDKLLLIETVVNTDFYLENIVEKIRKYGGEVVGVIVIVNICEGEYSNLLENKEHVIPVLNLFDIFTYLENNNLIEMFYSEKVKFYCEKETKVSIQKLVTSQLTKQNAENTSDNTGDNTKNTN